MTQRGYDKLQETLHHLKTTRREQISEYMGKAIEDGDLRESAAYDEARMQQSENEAKIAEIEAQLERAQIMNDDEIDTSAVGVGATVVVEDAGGKQRTLEGWSKRYWGGMGEKVEKKLPWIAGWLKKQ